MKQVKEKIKNIDNIVLAIILVVVATILAILVPAYSSAMETGKNVGQTIGTATGNLIGSLEGTSEGFEKGKNDALIPKVDISAIQDKVHGLGNLEVLVIDMEYMDVFKSDQNENPDYAEIFTEKVKMIYTVDLTRAIVGSIRDNELIVRIPKVTYSDPSPIEGSYKKIASYQKGSHAGSNTDGINRASESHNKLMEEIKEKAGSTYLDMANEAAKAQVQSLTKAMTGKNCTVEFYGG